MKHREGRDFYTFCGGSLISRNHIITAAHCVYFHKPYELFIGIGDWDKEVQEFGEILSAVIKIDIHPDYNPMTFQADLAVVELAQSIEFDQYKQPIALAQSETLLNSSDFFNVTGWGTLRQKGQSSQRLRKVTIPFVPHDKCQEIYNVLRLTSVKVQEGMICAGKNLHIYLYNLLDSL